jgi:hypothetical protein
VPTVSISTVQQGTAAVIAAWSRTLPTGLLLLHVHPASTCCSMPIELQSLVLHSSGFSGMMPVPHATHWCYSAQLALLCNRQFHITCHSWSLYTVLHCCSANYTHTATCASLKGLALYSSGFASTAMA